MPIRLNSVQKIHLQYFFIRKITPEILLKNRSYMFNLSQRQEAIRVNNFVYASIYLNKMFKQSHLTESFIIDFIKQNSLVFDTIFIKFLENNLKKEDIVESFHLLLAKTYIDIICELFFNNPSFKMAFKEKYEYFNNTPREKAVILYRELSIITETEVIPISTLQSMSDRTLYIRP